MLADVADSAWDIGGTQAALAELDRLLVGWRPDLVGTLLFLQRDGQVLLIRKRRGHGAGKINGPGGKPEPGETPEQCVLRETEEEVGVRAQHPRLAGMFRFVDTREPDWLGYIFTADEFHGTPHATAEAIPRWYAADALPLGEMWDDDRHWLPRVLAGESLRGDFLFTGGALEAYRLRSLAEGEAWPVVDGL